MASAQVPVGIRTRKIPQLTLESDHLAHNEQQQQQEGDASRKVEIRTKKRRRATRVRTSCEPVSARLIPSSAARQLTHITRSVPRQEGPLVSAARRTDSVAQPAELDVLQ